jgi:uncharacterized phage infection (PIP) family protein YhgE
MKWIGILLILSSIIWTTWWIITHESYKGALFFLCLIAVFVGLVLIFQDRVTELTVKGVGTVKAVTQQIQSDAEIVAELKKRVENQSATVDLIAKEASKAKAISEEVADKNKLAEEKLDILNKTITKANDALADINAETEFIKTVIAAQNDDRKAFDKLKEWSEEKNHRFSSRAAQAWSTIFENHSKPFSFSGLKMPWIEGFDPSKLSLLELSQQYKAIPAQLKTALLEYIWKRDDISKIDRLDFMMEIMTSDSSLTAVEYAGRHFVSGTGQNIKPLAVEYLSDWWGNHRKEFE